MWIDNPRERSPGNGLFRQAKEQVYLQFVPGIVAQVVANSHSLSYDGTPRKINSILAKVHVDSKFMKSSLLDETNRYYPMMRGFADVPAVGDQVLLTTIGGVQYYLGPINTMNNPNFNIDHLKKREKLIRKTEGGDPIKATKRDLMGISNNFKLMPNLSRLQKMFNRDLDDPNREEVTIGEIHGDMMLEGRHGNSIRIGSRNINPYIIISNGRSPENSIESTKDGSLMCFIENGSIRQHFFGDGEYDGENITQSQWILANDTIEENERKTSDLVSIVNGDSDATEKIYDYDKNQIFQLSDRIVINADTESVFISAREHVHVGAGNSLTISVNKDTIIESKNIYLGKASKTAEIEEKQGIIVGENWRALFEEFLELLSRINGFCQGSPIPPGIDNGPPGSFKKAITSFMNKAAKDANNFVSNKHFIEEN